MSRLLFPSQTELPNGSFFVLTRWQIRLPTSGSRGAGNRPRTQLQGQAGIQHSLEMAVMGTDFQSNGSGESE